MHGHAGAVSCKLAAMRRLCLLALFAACPAPPPQQPTPKKFSDVADGVLAEIEKLEPDMAVELGHHEADGLLPDRSEQGLRVEDDLLREQREMLAKVENLTPEERAEH